jgi:predicted NBD/HSP70 family sugar kinase
MKLLGLDISERRTVGVVLDERGNVVRRARRDGPADGSVNFARELTSGHSIDAFGVAIDGAEEVAALGEIDGLPCPEYVMPGAAAVTAESWVGAARGLQHAVCLKIGERVLAGIMLNGHAWSGAHGLAGSAAWFALNPVERQDYRKFGSLAAEVSSKGIARRLSWRIQAGDHSAVLERAGDLEAITSTHVFDGARSGDGVSISVVRDTAKYIGMAIANLASCIDPEMVVLSGDAATAGDLLFEPVRLEFLRRIPPQMADRVQFAISPLGDDGLAIGAARLAVLARA